MRGEVLPHELSARLGAIARSLRSPAVPVPTDYRCPQLAEADDFFFEGRSFRRMRMLLLCRGCTAGACTMCPLPNEAVCGDQREPSSEELVAQFEAAFSESGVDAFECINVYTNGNFFCDRELPSDVRRHIYTRVRESRAEMLMVESLPQFVSGEGVEEARRLLGKKRLIVCIGLESADDFVREVCINSPCTKPAFERAIARLREADFTPRVFLMLKPPFLTEREAIADVEASAAYLAALDIHDPTICPTRVAPHTIARMLFDEGSFSPPHLWSVVDVLRRLHSRCAPRVAVSNLRAERNPQSIPARACDRCRESIVTAIERYNVTRDESPLESLSCECRLDYQGELEREEQGKLPLVERVARFLGL